MSEAPPTMPIRVLVVDSSPQGQAALRRALSDDPGIQWVGSAMNGAEAQASAARPAVIVVGHRPASTDALLSIRHIMHASPVPIVVVSPVASAAQGTLAFDLLQAGALAVVAEPWNEPDEAQALAQLRQAIRLMSEVKVVRRWRAHVTPMPLPNAHAAPQPAPPAGRGIELVAIGASTGGPVVLKSILSRLPRAFPVPIVIVQHISNGFVDGLARWLCVDSPIPVKVAAAGEALLPGHAYLAPDGTHMRLAANGTVALDFEPAINGHRPAVSCLFRSIAERRAAHAIGVLLTGMGKDGAAELKMMRDAGAVTIAQDRASSVVYGMPGEAMRCQAATYVMSPEEIAGALAQWAAA